MGKRTALFLAAAVLVVAAAIGALVWKWDTLVARISEKAVVAERQACQQRTRELQKFIARLQQERESRAVPPERLVEVFGSDSPFLKGVSPRHMNCQSLEASLRAFCRYLDAGKTRQAHKIQQPSWTLFNQIIGTLQSHPPTITGESYRAPLIIQNSFYFFRLLGRKRIDFLRDILKEEADVAEPLLGILYYRFMPGRQCYRPSISTLRAMYRYAGFFLNTLGGHSYLCRRESKVRLLTLYYSILVIHQANLRQLNEAGLDIRFFLPLLFNEIQNRKDLLYSEEYLETLSELQLRYFGSG